GHIDGTGKITARQQEANAVYYDIAISPEFRALVQLKGSIAIDGVSLTVFGVEDDTVTLSLIPHTVSATILGDKYTGDDVNVEFDMLAKYVQNIMHHQMIAEEGRKNDVSYHR